ncbi:MAG: DUF357 domain-containing protein [Candidatus Altiarchaeota archaeon]|nr:DUF357 domain-containing protein [Candidatus Altiarchaeota archaeon]
MDLKKSIQEMQEILKSLKVLDSKADHIVLLSNSYTNDALHFFEKGNKFDALEAYAIGWAYIDTLLHLKMVEVKDLQIFTVEKR